MIEEIFGRLVGTVVGAVNFGISAVTPPPQFQPQPTPPVQRLMPKASFWSCPCRMCPECGTRRFNDAHPLGGIVEDAVCGHSWDVPIGAFPGNHAENATELEMMVLCDDDIAAQSALRSHRRTPHDEAAMMSPASTAE